MKSGLHQPVVRPFVKPVQPGGPMSNSALGLRTNRNAGGMELLCGLLGKAPLFGLMTDEGRMANWLIDVKTSKEPDWGVLGTAIGLMRIAGAIQRLSIN